MGQIDGRSHDKGGKEETNRGVERSVGVWVVYSIRRKRARAMQERCRRENKILKAGRGGKKGSCQHLSLR